jgi:hypothetical protein
VRKEKVCESKTVSDDFSELGMRVTTGKRDTKPADAGECVFVFADLLSSIGFGGQIGRVSMLGRRLLVEARRGSCRSRSRRRWYL